MIPPLIVRRAMDLALGIIAITDHNSAENVAATIEAARGFDLAVLPGMEVQTKEEVHLVCLFDTVEQALDWQDAIYAHLPPLKNRPDFFGAQFVVDATGDFVRYNERLLATSTSLSVEQVAAKVDERGGLCIAAHVDRPSYSLLANLGFVPEGIRLAAVEITPGARAEDMRRLHPSLAGYPFIYSGDVHRLEEMTDRTILTLAEPTVTEISMAFRGAGGRKVKVLAN
jgi:PHP family Zn ribbon phosphoesterase